MGIASALEASKNEINFVVACDIPHIDLHCIRKMLAEAKEADIGVAGGNGEGLIFKKGKILKKVKEEQILEVLREEILQL